MEEYKKLLKKIAVKKNPENKEATNTLLELMMVLDPMWVISYQLHEWFQFSKEQSKKAQAVIDQQLQFVEDAKKEFDSD